MRDWVDDESKDPFWLRVEIALVILAQIIGLAAIFAWLAS